MENLGEQHCRLCLNTISDENFKEMKNVTKNILDVLVSNLNLDNSSKYIVCNVCSRRVMEARKFKSMCVYTENTIISYVDGVTGCSVDLKEIYMKEIEKKHLIPTLGNYKVCRFCMQLVKDKFIPVHEMAVDMIKMYIPEINLTVVEDPVICEQCLDSFVSHSSFIKNCLELNKKIKSFCDRGVVNDSTWMPSVDAYIKTEEVDIKSENEWLETDSAVIRSECEEIWNRTNRKEIKTEDEDKKSEACYVTYSVSADSINRNKFSRDNKYSATDHTSTLSRYLLSHQDICVFPCDTCDSSCKQKYSLKRDLLRHKCISGMEEFRCDTCDYKTKRKDHLKSHLLRHKNFSETEVFECDTCDYKTKHKCNLRMHLLTHKDISEREVFECDTCDYKSNRKSDLKRHQLTHKDISEREVFECDACDYKTKHRSSLKRHQLIHKNISEAEVFECDTCDYKTKRKYNLRMHLLTHKDISEREVFECDACDYKSNRKSDLNRHQLTQKHISEREVFECDTCDYKTKHRSNLKKHQLTHKDISETKVFECDTCNYKTKRKDNLKRHQLKHKDISETDVFECDTCNYKTKRKNSLKKHQLTHKNISETEVFECDT